MNYPTDDMATLLRDRLDQLAHSQSGGGGIDGAGLYRRGVRRRRRRIVATTGLIALAVVIVGAAIGSAARPEASSDPSSPGPNSGCEIPDGWAPAIEAGALTEEKACQELQPGEQEIPTAPHIMHFPGGPSLAIEGWVHEDSVEECRAGMYNSGDGAEALYCNTILMIAAGELEPTHICEPSDCGKLKLLWAYDEAQLRDLAQGEG